MSIAEKRAFVFNKYLTKMILLPTWVGVSGKSEVRF